LKKILPRIDDLERIIKNTPKDLKNNPLYEWITSTFDKLLKDLEKLWVKSFVSIWEEVNPDKHEVVTALPWKEENIIIDEFEKWYMLDDRVLRYAKVVVGMGND
jgi:molecular chaperone GrpE